ncbi:MAG TPA: magnesium/cobalt transporter CorA [Pyrinomonadaceae bacterium]|jgi:magnesium transporter|nr:magnesium/cobalt transporter CorA [Pyrinomonadaceae bacterium]
MEIFVYRQGAQSVERGFSADDLPDLLAEESNVVWVDFLGETPELIEEARKILLDIFKFHPLTVEDCIETRNQPKVEAFPDYFYFIVHAVKPEQTSSSNFTTKELDGYLGRNYLVTFHTERFRSIKTLKQQLRNSPVTCQRGPAYVLHHILDFIVDLYLPVIDDFENSINRMEDRIFLLKKSDTAMLEEIMILRRSVARMKRISLRQLDVLSRMAHGEFAQIPKPLLPFFRDLKDHLLRISDLSESYRDLVNGLFDIHFSVTANRTNDIMKLLAIFSAIMLPLSLIAGIYGMNFENMPELKTPYGYFMTLATMAVVAIGLLIYFWYKGWIFKKEEAAEETGDGADIHRTRINE